MVEIRDQIERRPIGSLIPYARLMEIDPRYCDVIVRRWQDFTGQQAQLESTSQSWGYVATERAQA